MFKNLVGGLVLLAVLGCNKDEAKPVITETALAPLQVKRGLLVAHGMGGIDGVRTSNSLEALQCNYKRGFRWFEVDLATTSDGELMCFHKGDEKLAGLPQHISDLTVNDVEGKKYAGRYPITRLSKLLAETDKLGDVVLVLDTEGWSERMEQALSRTLGYGPKRTTRLVLQAYREKDLKGITALSKELNASILLNLQQTTVDDAKVEELVKRTSPIGVVASTERFTPWLAERLQAINTPVLVQTINEHRDLVSLTRAGATAFYTDRYVPFGTLTADPTAAFNCGETKASAQALAPWTRRDLSHKEEVRLPACATRKGRRAELKECDDKAQVRSDGLAVPPAKAVHVEIDAEAGDTPATFWVELVEKLKREDEPKTLRARETTTLKAKERRTLKFDVDLPQGSRSVEARLGLATKKDTLTLHQLRVFHGDAPTETSASETDLTPSQAESDAGD